MDALGATTAPWKHGMMRLGGMMGPAAMRIIFALMDRDSDGTVSLEEFQAAHERIFKAMDTIKMEPSLQMRFMISSGNRVICPAALGDQGVS